MAGPCHSPRPSLRSLSCATNTAFISAKGRGNHLPDDSRQHELSLLQRRPCQHLGVLAHVEHDRKRGSASIVSVREELLEASQAERVVAAKWSAHQPPRGAYVGSSASCLHRHNLSAHLRMLRMRVVKRSCCRRSVRYAMMTRKSSRMCGGPLSKPAYFCLRSTTFQERGYAGARPFPRIGDTGTKVSMSQYSRAELGRANVEGSLKHRRQCETRQTATQTMRCVGAERM